MKDLKRLERITAILHALQAKRVVTAPNLADKFGVSIRTIYRDIKALEESGVPILTEEGKGYSLMPGYTLPPTMLTDAEAQALVTAQKFIEKTRDASLITAYQDAMEKIQGILPGANLAGVQLLADRIAIIKPSSTTSNYLSTLQIALTKQILVRLTYQTLYQQEITRRLVEPMGLFHASDKWILIAWCQLRKDYRSFRLDQIKSLQLTSESFTPRDFDLEKYLHEQVKWLKR